MVMPCMVYKHGFELLTIYINLLMVYVRGLEWSSFHGITLSESTRGIVYWRMRVHGNGHEQWCS